MKDASIDVVTIPGRLDSRTAYRWIRSIECGSQHDAGRPRPHPSTHAGVGVASGDLDVAAAVTERIVADLDELPAEYRQRVLDTGARLAAERRSPTE